MKKLIHYLTVIAFLSCTSQAPKPMTDAEKAAIIKEVTDVNKLTIDALNKIDFPTYKSVFLDSPDFLSVSSDGTILNLEQVLSKEKGFFESALNVNAVILSEDVKILERDLVVSTLLLKTEVTLNTGVNVTFEKLEVTGICKKIDNQWKIIFYQESGLPPTVIK